MSDETKPSSAPQGNQEEAKETPVPPSPAPAAGENQGEPEKKPAYVPPATREKRQRSVVHYIAILFAAAFLLMLMTYLMDRRENTAAMDNLNQSLSGLQESLSDQSSLQDIYEDNMALIQQVQELEDQVADLSWKTRKRPPRLWIGSGRSTRPMCWAGTPCAAA